MYMHIRLYYEAVGTMDAWWLHCAHVRGARVQYNNRHLITILRCFFINAEDIKKNQFHIEFSKVLQEMSRNQTSRKYVLGPIDKQPIQKWLDPIQMNHFLHTLQCQNNVGHTRAGKFRLEKIFAACLHGQNIIFFLSCIFFVLF